MSSDTSRPGPWIIAHRGHSAAEVENSLAALERAIEAGADAVECDVRIAGDGVLVVSHDADLGRLTGHPTAVAATPADRLDALARRGGVSVPRLDTMMHSARGRVPLMLDVKSLDPAVISAIADGAAETGYAPSDLAVGLRTPDLIAATREHLPDARILALHGSRGPLDAFLASGVTLVRMWEHTAGAVVIGDLKARGCTVWITVGGPETGRDVGDGDLATLRSLLAAGADGLIVNDPDLGRKAAGT